MEELTQILSDATSRIERGYFLLNIDSGDPVYRERVYCYELYHQMRLLWSNTTPYYLNGEVDKASHPILKELVADRAKPDLLVHQPGYMRGNHAVIELKASTARPAGIKKGLKTLSLFVRNVGYQRAIYLMYGESPDEALVERARRAAADVGDLAPIELWLHQQVGQPACCQLL